MGERDVQPRERACEAADGVGEHGVSERLVLGAVLVGVDQDLVDLRAQSVEHMGHHRSPVERHEPLVDRAHAPALAPGENDPGDALVFGHALRRVRMNSHLHA